MRDSKLSSADIASSSAAPIPASAPNSMSPTQAVSSTAAVAAISEGTR